MFSPNASQANISVYEPKGNHNSLNSRRRARPAHQSQAALATALTAHPPKKPRQRSVSAQRELNASPEAQLVIQAQQPAPVVKSYITEKKVSAERWAQNEKYCVEQLVALPMELRDRAGNLNGRVTATTDGPAGSALLIKESGAYVWKYDDAHPLPKPDHFPLPRDEPPAADGLIPLALGSLVGAVAGSDEPGFVAVMPVTGRIAYWDAIGSAIAEGLFTRKRGVEGRVELAVAETVQSICSIEPAGFVLCMTTGRLAHLALRDGTGKPLVTVTTMRSYGAGALNLFSGLANAFKGSNSKRDVVAVRPAKVTSREAREVVVATTRGHITQWEINRSGAAVIIADVDVREQLLQRVISTGPDDLLNRDRELFSVLDVATTQNPREGRLEVLVLTAFASSTDGETYYSLVKVLFSQGKHHVFNAYPITCYSTPVDKSSSAAPPRVYLPNPSRTAFVVFPKAILVVTIIAEDKYNVAELDQREVGFDRTHGFEDVIEFRKDANVEIIGSGYEDITGSPADGFGEFSAVKESRRKIYSPNILVVTKGAGVLRVSVMDNEDAEHGRPQPSPKPVPVKVKIEQAVFYGGQEKNLLNFDGWTQTNYTKQEVELAARTISKDILSCRSRYVPPGGPSVDAQLGYRAQMIHRLAQHLKDVYQPLSRETKWRLCWNAEKLEAARAVYDAHNERLRNKEDYQEVLKEAVIAQFTKHEEPIGEDPLRQWFEQHILALYELIPFLNVAYTNLSKKQEADAQARVEESNEICIDALNTGYFFRANNVELYGLDENVDKKGVPLSLDLPMAPWTSSPDILTLLGRQIEMNNKLLSTLPADVRKGPYGEKIITQLVHLVEISCRSFVERATWCAHQTDPATLEAGQVVEDRYLRSRNNWIQSLDKHERRPEAVAIAESYEDYRTLVELSFEEILKNTLHLETHGAELDNDTRQEFRQTIKDVEHKLSEYFQNFGKEFAFILYQYQIEKGTLKALVEGFPSFKHYLTEFLHAHPQYAKISWINDITNANFDGAAASLVHAATEETDLWCKKIELSIGKLAMMHDRSEVDIASKSMAFDSELHLIDQQEMFWSYVAPELRGAIDNAARVQLAMEAWGHHLPKGSQFRALFERGLTKLVSKQVVDVRTLIDLLTLKKPDNVDYLADSGTDWPGEFCVALQMLAYARLSEEDRREAERTIWRRCWLADDWPRILDTAGKTDEENEELAQNTQVFGLMKYGLLKGIFQQPSPLSPLLPLQTLSNTGLLMARFPDMRSNLRDTLTHEIMQENMEIKDSLTKTKIEVDKWFENLWRSAQAWAVREREGNNGGIGGSYVDVPGVQDGEEEEEEEDAMDTD